MCPAGGALETVARIRDRRRDQEYSYCWCCATDESKAIFNVEYVSVCTPSDSLVSLRTIATHTKPEST